MFGHPGVVVLVPFGPNTHPRRRIFQHFLGNGALAKIVFPLWWKHNFEGSDPQKIGPESDSERHRQENTTKNASGAVSGRMFLAPGPFLVDFWAALGSQNGRLGPTFGRLSRLFGPLLVDMWRFFAQGCSGRVLGSILGVLGGLPGWFWEGFCLNLWSSFIQTLVQILSTL